MHYEGASGSAVYNFETLPLKIIQVEVVKGAEVTTKISNLELKHKNPYFIAFIE